MYTNDNLMWFSLQLSDKASDLEEMESYLRTNPVSTVFISMRSSCVCNDTAVDDTTMDDALVVIVQTSD